MKEEFARLIKLFQQAAEGKGVTIQDVFHKSLEFIEHLKEQIKTGTPEDQQAAVQMLNELYQHMRNQTKILCEKAGMTEDELMARSENPQNFSPELWRTLQEDKAKLAKSGQQLVDLIKDQGGAAVSPKEPKKRKGKKSSQWMRS